MASPGSVKIEKFRSSSHHRESLFHSALIQQGKYTPQVSIGSEFAQNLPPAHLPEAVDCHKLGIFQMPILPSGLKLALYVGHIMEPDRNWFRAPKGHFWYWSPRPRTPSAFPSCPQAPQASSSWGRSGSALPLDAQARDCTWASSWCDSGGEAACSCHPSNPLDSPSESAGNGLVQQRPVRLWMSEICSKLRTRTCPKFAVIFGHGG